MLRCADGGSGGSTVCIARLISMTSLMLMLMAEQEKANKTVQGTGTSRLVQRQIERYRRVAPIVDLLLGN
jgi:hypothetical protein